MHQVVLDGLDICSFLERICSLFFMKRNTYGLKRASRPMRPNTRIALRRNISRMSFPFDSMPAVEHRLRLNPTHRYSGSSKRWLEDAGRM
jgi:hypothetical protein